VSQISPPIRIVLIAVIGLIAAWMLFLRPKTEEVPAPSPAPATAPGVTGLSNAVDKAKDASATSDAANDKIQKASGEEGASASKAGKAGAKPNAASQFVTGREKPVEPLTAAQTKGLPKQIVTALNQRKVFVVGVFDSNEKRWARMPADDRLARRDLQRANRYKGDVKFANTSLEGLSKLNAVVGNAGITQTPAVVVVDRNRVATVLDGFVEITAINQAIQDARRNSTEVRITDPFVRQLNRTCANYEVRLSRFNAPSSRREVKPAARRFDSLLGSYRRGFVSLKAPARYKPLDRQITAVLTRGEAFSAALHAGSMARIEKTYGAMQSSASSLDRKFADVGATSCDGAHLK
jgi:hypothetical protein